LRQRPFDIIPVRAAKFAVNFPADTKILVIMSLNPDSLIAVGTGPYVAF